MSKWLTIEYQPIANYHRNEPKEFVDCHRIRRTRTVDFTGDSPWPTFPPTVDERLRSHCKKEQRPHINMSQRSRRGLAIFTARRLGSLILICLFACANTGFSQSAFLKVQSERSVGPDLDPHSRSLSQHSRSQPNHRRYHQRSASVTFLARNPHVSSRGKALAVRGGAKVGGRFPPMSAAASTAQKQRFTPLQKTVTVNLAAWVVLVGGVLAWSRARADPEQGKPVLENPGFKSFRGFIPTDP